MGQRTQILVQTLDKDNKQTNRLYHCQWGNGKVMPMLFMEMFARNYNADFSKDFHELGKLTSQNLYNLTDCEDMEPLLENVNVADIEQLKKVFEPCDNNNGYMVVQIKESKQPYTLPDYKIGFLLGWEDVKGGEAPCERFITLQEFAERIGGSFYPKMWQDTFECFLQAAEVENFADEIPLF